MTDNEEALNRKLYEKVSAEMEAYENKLLAMPPEEILEHAYAYATKQDIVLALEEYNDIAVVWFDLAISLYQKASGCSIPFGKLASAFFLFC